MKSNSEGTKQKQSQSLPDPGPYVLCLCEGEGEEQGRSLACSCGPYWALGPWAAAEADPGPLLPTEEHGMHGDPGGGQFH